MAKTRKGRIRQVANWLRQEFPTPYPVRLRIEVLGPPGAKQGLMGETYRSGKCLVIRIDSRLKWMEAINTLLHEWGHAEDWRLNRMENVRPPHDDSWALKHGKIYRWYHDEGGALRSRDFPY